MTEVLSPTLDGVKLGEPQPFRNLCVVPLLDGGDGGVLYRTLKEGLESGEVEVAEVSEHGSVPNLKVINRADVPLLLVDGEELAGAKQNRIVNTSLLLEARSETVIPVSCTEAGRWRYTSHRFADSGLVMAARSRYNKSARLLYNLKMNAAYDAGQSDVWKDIETLHGKLGSRSATRAMKDAYEQRERDMADYLAAFPLVGGQCGMVVFLNGRPAGADYVSRTDAYRHLHDKLLRSHVIEAIGEKSQPDATDWKLDAHLFLQSLWKAPEVSTHRPVGLGEDWRYEGDHVNGSALVYQGEIIHLSAYARAMTDEMTPDAGVRREVNAPSPRRAFGHWGTPSPDHA